MKKFFLMFTMFLFVAATANAAIVLDYADNQSEEYPTIAAAQKFAQLVKAKTNGRVTVNIQPGAKLANEEIVLKQLEFGTIDMSRISIPYYANTFDEFKVLQMPYIFDSAAHMHKVLDGAIGDGFLKLTEKENVIALCWFDAGARNFYTTNKPIKTLEDFKLLKLRVQPSEVSVAMANALGATPVPLAYGEVYGALISGEIDGAENNFSSYISVRHNDAAKYLTLTEHMRQPELVVISKSALKELTPADQKAVREAAKEAAKYEREIWAAYEADAKKEAIRKGTKIITLAPAERAKIKAAMQKLEASYSKEYKAIIDKIRNTK